VSFLSDYEPVEDRLRQFWEDHPYGRVITDLEHHSDGDYIVRAEVYVGNELRNDPPTATGYAHDSVATLPANMKSSALEVCETSAIGRALANAGYAPKGKRPSREEMQKASPSQSTGSGEQAAPAGHDIGEGVTPAGDSPAATPEQWARLVEKAGSEVRAVNRLNRVNKAKLRPTYKGVQDAKRASTVEVTDAIVGEV
jgi:hypothetical protein